MGVLLLDDQSFEDDASASDGGGGDPDGGDLALRQRQRQQRPLYKPPEPTQVDLVMMDVCFAILSVAVPISVLSSSQFVGPDTYHRARQL